MAKKKETVEAQETVELKGWDSKSNNALRDALFERNIEAPLDDEGKLIRKQAIALLDRYDQVNPQRENKYVKVVFHNTGDEASLPYVFLAHNGTAYTAPFEKPVVLPEIVVKECCDHAVKKVYKLKGKSADGGLEYDEIFVQMQPYTFMGYVTTDDNSVEKLDMTK